VALAAAEEAATFCRELAAQGPDAFRPNLAAALAVPANCLDSLDRSAEALAATVEAITALSEAFIEHSCDARHWMDPMVQQYQDRCERLGQSPDMELLGPVVAILRDKRTQTGEKPDEH